MTFIHTNKEEKKKKREQRRLSQTLSRSTKVSHAKQKSFLKNVTHQGDSQKFLAIKSLMHSHSKGDSHTHSNRYLLIIHAMETT